MRRKTRLGIVSGFVASVLVPMWVVALNDYGHVEEIAIDQSVSRIRPLSGFVATPNELMPSEVGVVVWLALFGLVAALVATHRFMDRLVRPADGEASTPPDEGTTFPWIETENRWIAAYHAPSEDVTGLVAMGGLTVLAIVFAALFTSEYLTLARTQFFGVYLAGLFLSLAGSTIAYYAWFMPHVEVAEERSHRA
ncbi:hypothetical protein EFA46_013665 (plasmid) [Halarchaeum sp. CBA1220]|uniref:hypothetical protein n=1 Tax=Halarchaeum sp. CBA1220 TaxID=1853682 RepID=UPI000F3AA6D5|nr:hypothetical protein [Halarchaeum sp. CBA1220]QLC35308.1 hypothetical protein EFA46_013665 [Halarchaeum sp. CBA1220]